MNAGVHVAGSDAIRVGLIGCGGRGRGAMQNVAEAADGVQIWALGDAFQDRVDMAKTEAAKMGSKSAVTDDRCFVGLDAYQKVIGSGANYIILATPPGYRPLHLRAAIEAGKHVFAEKPVGTCPTGIRSVLETAKIAAQRNLGIVVGTQRRHQPPYVETIGRIHDGAIGAITGGHVYWVQGDIWAIPRTPQMSDVEWLIRNWQYFTRMGGDHVVEQHIHNIDVANWVMNAHPVSAMATGGRQARTQPQYGHIYDHFAVEFEYPNGVVVQSMAAQQPGRSGQRVAERFEGTKGWADPSGSIHGPETFRYKGSTPNPYVQEHADLIASIRSGNPLNEGKRIAESTLTAIMARESAYSGQVVTWDQILASTLDLRPDSITWEDKIPVPPVAMPGTYKLV